MIRLKRQTKYSCSLLPSPTAYPRQERKKSHWLSQLPLSAPSSFGPASVMVLESLLPPPLPMVASVCFPSGYRLVRSGCGNYCHIWYASKLMSLDLFFPGRCHDINRRQFEQLLYMIPTCHDMSFNPIAKKCIFYSIVNSPFYISS